MKFLFIFFMLSFTICFADEDRNLLDHSTIRINETTTSYWMDIHGRLFIEIDKHIYEITPLKHAERCPCNWYNKLLYEISG